MGAAGRHRPGRTDSVMPRHATTADTSQGTAPGRLPGVHLAPFEQAVTDHGAVVLRVCRAVLGPADADDAWSETFLAALRAYPSLRPGSDVRAWLVTIAHRKAIDRSRANARAPRPTGDVPERGQADEAAGEDDDRLWAALRSRPFKQRAALTYRYVADLSYREIADLLGTSEAAARRSAADGIAALRRHYPRQEER